MNCFKILNLTVLSFKPKELSGGSESSYSETTNKCSANFICMMKPPKKVNQTFDCEKEAIKIAT